MFSIFAKKKDAGHRRETVAIRLEAVGGQGAHSAGKIIAEAAVIGMSYTGNHFSSFGSEKRGSPVSSFVRFSTTQKPIRSATHITTPDLLVIFHESLIDNHPSVLAGATDKTDVLINSNQSPQELKFPKNFVAKRIATINATEITRRHHCGLNAAMLGACSFLLPEIGDDSIKTYFQHYFSKLNNQKIKDNLKAYNDSFKKIKIANFSFDQASDSHQPIKLPDMGWLNAPLGGTITNPGNSVLKNQSASRKGVVPHFDRSICFDCGFCDMVCPDFCFVWDLSEPQAPTLKGIDYQYCKGCQKCITVCPVQALTPVPEESLESNDKSQKLFSQSQNQISNLAKHPSDLAFHIDHLSERDFMISPQAELLNPKSYLRSVVKMEEIEKFLTEEMKNKIKNKL